MQTINGFVPELSTGITRTDLVAVPVLVRRGLDRCWRDRPRYRRGTKGERVRYLHMMVRSFEREARWWSVLIEWCYSSRSEGMDLVFGRAAIAAEAKANESAREYRRMAEQECTLLGGCR